MATMVEVVLASPSR